MADLTLKRHLGVYGVLLQRHSLLLVRKTRGPYLGQWDLPGGGLQHGEGVFEALKRELEEEIALGVRLQELQFWANVTATTEAGGSAFFISERSIM